MSIDQLRQRVYDAAFYSDKPGDPFPELLEEYVQARLGSVSVPLSEASGPTVRERSAKQTPSQLVPSLPSADGSIAQAKEALLNAITAYGNHEQRWRVRPATEAAVDHLILLCQSEAQQEKKPTTPRCTECGSERLGYDPGEVPGQGVDYCEKCGRPQIPESFYRIRDLESLAAERQQEIERLQRNPACVCTIDDGLVQEWVSKARAVAKSKGFTVAQPALAALREQTYRQAQSAIRAACGMCDGHGFTIETRTGSTADHHPACDGNCRECPIEVPVEEQYQEPCEYCGRPIDAIEKLITPASSAPSSNQETA